MTWGRTWKGLESKEATCFASLILEEEIHSKWFIKQTVLFFLSTRLWRGGGKNFLSLRIQITNWKSKGNEGRLSPSQSALLPPTPPRKPAPTAPPGWPWSCSDGACGLSRFSRVWLSVTPWPVACWAPLSMGFSRQESWRGLPCRPPGDLLMQGSNPRLLHLLHWQGGSLPLVPPLKAN